jgi:DNA-binding GntR family transcriptional regulator
VTAEIAAADAVGGVGGAGAPADDLLLPDRIEADLRHQILHGRIPPGGRINVRQLESVYGVSHIPIREAIRRLEGEGLVVNVPKRGVVAAEVSLRELDEIYDLRRIVEPHVIRRAVGAAGPAAQQRVAVAFAELERAEHGAPSVDFSAAHWDFHWSLLEPGASGEIERLVHKLWRVADRYLRLTHSLAVDVAAEQHHQLVTAYQAGDGEGAAGVLERHLHLTGNALRARFDELDLD